MESQRERKRTGKTRRSYLWFIGVIGVLILSLAAFGSAIFERKASVPKQSRSAAAGSPVQFSDARRQAAEFISYNRSIVLTSDQKHVMDDALSRIQAPCCAKFSIATCCCPCNLAKSSWGLSKVLITEHHYDAAQVRAAVTDWLQFTNPDGYTGDACFKRGCERSFEENGCGGMNERYIQ